MHRQRPATIFIICIDNKKSWSFTIIFYDSILRQSFDLRVPFQLHKWFFHTPIILKKNKRWMSPLKNLNHLHCNRYCVSSIVANHINTRRTYSNNSIWSFILISWAMRLLGIHMEFLVHPPGIKLFVYLDMQQELEYIEAFYFYLPNAFLPKSGFLPSHRGNYTFFHCSRNLFLEALGPMDLNKKIIQV